VALGGKWHRKMAPEKMAPGKNGTMQILKKWRLKKNVIAF